jgi:hypothetical protein
MAEARLQAIDDFRFETAHMIRCFFSQATMKLLGQSKTNNPMSRPSFHQNKASDNRSYRQADDETSDDGNRDGLNVHHGDTPPIRNRTIADWSEVRFYDYKVESCEHQDNANIHYQPCPESVSEEEEAKEPARCALIECGLSR